MSKLILRKGESRPLPEISLYLGISGLLVLTTEMNNEPEETVEVSSFDELSFEEWFSWN